MTDIFEIPMTPLGSAAEKDKMRRVMDTCRQMIRLIDEHPLQERMSIMLSFIVSGCINSDDPEGLWLFIQEAVEDRLPEAISTIEPLLDPSKAN